MTGTEEILSCLLGVSIGLIFLFFVLWRSDTKYGKRVAAQRDMAYENREVARAERDRWEAKYYELQAQYNEKYAEEEDMEYLRDSLLRAADDDPMT